MMATTLSKRLSARSTLSTASSRGGLGGSLPLPRSGAPLATVYRSAQFLSVRHQSSSSQHEEKSQRSKYGAFKGLSAVAGCALASAAWVTASAEEEGQREALFKQDQVQVICVIGPPLCGKATQIQRMAKYFDALPLGAEDDIFSEVALGTVGGSHLRLLINGWPKSDREASWLEQELCPITTFVYINVDPDSAVKRTSERAVYAVKTGHRLFHTISDDMIEEFKKRGKLIEINGNQSLEDTWLEIRTKLSDTLKDSSKQGGK